VKRKKGKTQGEKPPKIPGLEKLEFVQGDKQGKPGRAWNLREKGRFMRVLKKPGKSMSDC